MPVARENRIVIANQILGGMSDSAYIGIRDSVYKMRGFNLTNTPGLLEVSQGTTKISESLVDGFGKYGVVSTNGERYIFSADSGKIWRVKADFTMELCYTTVAGSGESKCLGAREFDGYIYWFTEEKLHRISTANALAATWATLDQDWQTFANGTTEEHPSVVQNRILFIGDGKNIAQVQDNVFSDDALENFPEEYTITALYPFANGLVIGTKQPNNILQTIAAFWNTWSELFQYQDYMPEDGLNAFLRTDNYVVGCAGGKGNLYGYSSGIMQRIKRIPGDWRGSNEAKINVDSVAERFDMPLFGLSNVSGNPTEQGIYSLGTYGPNFPDVLNLEYLISTGNTENIEIGAILAVGNDIIYAWKDGSNYGVDKVDVTKKQTTAVLETRVITADRTRKKNFMAFACYEDLPEGTRIDIYAKDNDGVYQKLGTEINSLNRIVQSEQFEGVTGQVKFVITTSGNDAPTIESFELRVI